MSEERNDDQIIGTWCGGTRGFVTISRSISHVGYCSGINLLGAEVGLVLATG